VGNLFLPFLAGMVAEPGMIPRFFLIPVIEDPVFAALFFKMMPGVSASELL
jgi:hypothetical protein